MPGTGQAMFRIVIHGTMSGSQTWSTGFFIALGAATATPTPAQCATIAGAADSAAQTWWNTLKGYQAPYCSYVGVRAYGYAAGSSTSSSTGESAASSPVAGVGTHPNVPYVSLVVSLRTAVSSRSTRGRMYVPLTDGTYYDGDGQATTSATSQFNSATRTMLNAVLTAAVAAFPSASSEIVVASFTDSKVTPVTQLRVDSLPDVQHRRVDKVGATSVNILPYPS